MLYARRHRDIAGLRVGPGHPGCTGRQPAVAHVRIDEQPLQVLDLGDALVGADIGVQASHQHHLAKPVMRHEMPDLGDQHVLGMPLDAGGDISRETPASSSFMRRSARPKIGPWLTYSPRCASQPSRRRNTPSVRSGLPKAARPVVLPA